MDTPFNHSEEDKTYLVSGWHYVDGYWHQSDSVLKNRSDGRTSVSFNDSYNDRDYNDIEAIYSLSHE